MAQRAAVEQTARGTVATPSQRRRQPWHMSQQSGSPGNGPCAGGLTRLLEICRCCPERCPRVFWRSLAGRHSQI